MFVRELETENPEVRLVKPDVERDAQLGVSWLKGPQGRSTLRLMGIAHNDNRESSLNVEQGRVRDFLSSTEHVNWMISHKGKVVGAAWADLHSTKNIVAPAVSIMIGDEAARGDGIGRAALASVMAFLLESGHPAIHARHIVENKASAHMLMRLGFVRDGLPYSDEDGLEWQNVTYSKGLEGVGRFLDDEEHLTNWPAKSADKLASLEFLSTKFGFGLTYSEHQVNDLLKEWHTFQDWPLLRRELFEKGFLDRNRDGSEYRRIK
jgi:RimJ/RimL family protein N-acetyltransferase